MVWSAAGPDSDMFRDALEDLCRELAQQVVRDGEGAQKFVTVEVAGDTFGLAPEPFAELVVKQMRAGYYRHDFFTREASPATDPRYKIVMMFNPHPSVSGAALCAAPQPLPPEPRRAEERSSLLAAFCAGGEARSEINGWVRLSGVDDRNFPRLIDRVTAGIFPRRDIRQERL